MSIQTRLPVCSVQSIGRKPWAFAAVYTVLSLFIEAVLLVVFRLRIPEDNGIIAPVVLTLPPLAATWCSEFRRPLKAMIATAALTSVLTLVVTIIGTRLSGVSTGLLEPIINRCIAGGLAAVIARRVLSHKLVQHSGNSNCS